MDNIQSDIKPPSFFKQYFLQILGVVIIILGLLVYLSVKEIDLNEDGSYDVLTKVVSVSPNREGLENKEKKDKNKGKKKDNKKNKNKSKTKTTTTTATTAKKQDTSTEEVKGFCDPTKFTPSEINNKCRQLSKENCNMTGCCVYLKDKCVGGDKNGPTFLSEGGKLLNVDYYYYKNQCYGNCKNK